MTTATRYSPILLTHLCTIMNHLYSVVCFCFVCVYMRACACVWGTSPTCMSQLFLVTSFRTTLGKGMTLWNRDYSVCVKGQRVWQITGMTPAKKCLWIAAGTPWSSLILKSQKGKEKLILSLQGTSKWNIDAVPRSQRMQEESCKQETSLSFLSELRHGESLTVLYWDIWHENIWVFTDEGLSAACCCSHAPGSSVTEVTTLHYSIIGLCEN